MPPRPSPLAFLDAAALRFNDDRCTSERVPTSDDHLHRTRSTCVGQPSGNVPQQERSGVEFTIQGTGFALYGSTDGKVEFAYSVDGAPSQEETLDDIPATSTSLSPRVCFFNPPSSSCVDACQTGVKKLWSLEHLDTVSATHTISLSPLSGRFVLDYITYTPYPGWQPYSDPEGVAAAALVTPVDSAVDSALLSTTPFLGRRGIFSSSNDGTSGGGVSMGAISGLIGGVLGLALIIWLAKVLRTQTHNTYVTSLTGTPARPSARTRPLRELRPVTSVTVPPPVVSADFNPADSGTILPHPPPSYGVPNPSIVFVPSAAPPPHTPPVAPGQQPPPYVLPPPPPSFSMTEGRVGG